MNLAEDREKRVALKANHSKVCKFPTAESCESVMELIVSEFDRAVGMQRALEPSRTSKKKNIKLFFTNRHTAENVHFLVPRNANPLFTGRSEILNRIIDSITSDEDNNPTEQKRFVLTGLGGQGKSEICLKVADQVRSS
jgi:hypothetical protein